jgi:polyhydroxyalkanoate synthase
MNESHTPANPFGWLAQLGLGHQQWATLMRSTVQASPLDERSKSQWDPALRHVIDATSPRNWLATNPEALQLAVDSGGASLVEGTRLFLADLAKGRITMSDDQAFAVGRDLATTPGSVVFENELMQLIQYAPSTPKVRKRPLVIVPPCINKFYILDLQPENSFAAHAVAAGHTVFLVSWRNVGAAEGHLTWDDYVDHGVLQALAIARRIRRSDQVNALGFCVGGTLLASALAVAAARDEDPASSVTLLTTLLDFSDTGELGLMVDEAGVAAREARIGGGGLLHGRELAQVFAALRANDLIWPYVVNGYLKGKAPRRSISCTGTATTRICRGRCTAGTCARPTCSTASAILAARCNAAFRSTCRGSTCRHSSMPRATTTSCRGGVPSRARAFSVARFGSCSARAGTLPA